MSIVAIDCPGCGRRTLADTVKVKRRHGPKEPGLRCAHEDCGHEWVFAGRSSQSTDYRSKNYGRRRYAESFDKGGRKP